MNRNIIWKGSACSLVCESTWGPLLCSASHYLQSSYITWSQSVGCVKSSLFSCMWVNHWVSYELEAVLQLFQCVYCETQNVMSKKCLEWNLQPHQPFLDKNGHSCTKRSSLCHSFTVCASNSLKGGLTRLLVSRQHLNLFSHNTFNKIQAGSMDTEELMQLNWRGGV